jgi:indole-3-glycerol phosphate synthase
MSRFLEAIVADKRDEVAEKKLAAPIAELVREAEGRDVRDFRAAISTGGGVGGVIAELKARTPTIPRFAQSLRLEELARTYQRCGAVAISVVTDEKRFGTSLDTVRRVRELTMLPVLAKEFVIDPYQLVEARAAGADAVLLIVRLLEMDALVQMLEIVRTLGMSALVETHTAEEIEIALAAGADIIGINNRDLDRMEVSLDTTRQLAKNVPEGVAVVAESGIQSRADIEDLAAHGAHAFLVGNALLSAEDPEGKLRELVGR